MARSLGRLMAGLALLLSGCGATVRPTTSSIVTTIAATPTAIATLPQATPISVTATPTTAPTSIQNTNWAAVTGAASAGQQVGTVLYADLRGLGADDAVVPVLSSGSAGFGAVEIWGYHAGALQRLFTTGSLQGASVTLRDGVIVEVRSVNASSPVNSAVTDGAQLTPDALADYYWNGGAFVTGAYPAIYPAATWATLDQDQAAASAGHDPWMLDPRSVAMSFGERLLRWPRRDESTTLVSSVNGQASIRLNDVTTNAVITVTLEQLVAPLSGVWAVTDARGATLALSSPKPLAAIANPASVASTGTAFENVLNARILAATYQQIGQSRLTADGASFSGVISYGAFGAPTDAIVMVFSDSGRDGSIDDVSIEKALAG